MQMPNFQTIPKSHVFIEDGMTGNMPGCWLRLPWGYQKNVGFTWFNQDKKCKNVVLHGKSNANWHDQQTMDKPAGRNWSDAARHGEWRTSFWVLNAVNRFEAMGMWANSLFFHFLLYFPRLWRSSDVLLDVPSDWCVLHWIPMGSWAFEPGCGVERGHPARRFGAANIIM